MQDKKAIMEDPQVIAQIQIRSASDIPSRREQFLYEYHTCCLCGSELTFTHVTHFVNQEVTEEAYCYTCNIRTKKEAYRLQ